MELLPIKCYILLVCSVTVSTGNIQFVQNFADVIGVLQSGSQVQVEKDAVVRNSYESESAAYNPTVDTTSGLVIGSTFTNVHGFFSIPYAAPPIGNLRFRDTEPIQRRSELINATVPDYIACRQRPNDECQAGYCLINQNEDCLVLNVFVPRHVNIENAATSKLPVLLWIHGGAFTSGSGTMPKYDGRYLSNATGCVVVSINYRLGAYGFLVYNKGNDNLNGNQGLKDQQMAMKWVQENIELFGGDKNRVTIFGESAGAQSVMWHMLSPISRPLFRRAILESNAAVFPHQTPDEAMDVTNRLLFWLGCNDDENEFECLLRRMERCGAFSTNCIDGVEFTDQPLTLFQSGQWNTDKEYIIGANTQEVEILQYYIPFGGNLSKRLFELTNTVFLGEETGQKVADYYEELVGPDGDDYSKVLGIEAGDGFFICPSRAMSRFTFETADNPNNIYFYMFGMAPDGKYCHEVYPKNETCGYAYHSAELPYVFRTGPDYGYIYTEDEIIVNEQMSKYWGNFARNGNPNDDTGGLNYPDFTFWPAYINSDDINSWSNVHILPASFVETRYKEDICDFWDSLNFYVQMPPVATTSMEVTTQEVMIDTTKITTTTATTTTTEEQTTTSSTMNIHVSHILSPLLIFTSLLNGFTI